jgi:NDP-sugar pyrophosphorylase family protein
VNALVLCAGFGRRLGALGENRPKPLLEVGGIAIVEHILWRLSAQGFTRVFINLHYRAEEFGPRLGDGSRFGLELHYRFEPAPLGTGGTARDVLADLGEELLVHYGDILTDHDLRQLVDQHHRSPAWATVLLHQRPGSNSAVMLEEDGRISRFVERPSQPLPPEQRPIWSFSGVGVLSPVALAALPQRSPLDLARDLFPDLAAAGRLYGQQLAGHRQAIDSPERLQAAQDDWALGRFRPFGSHQEELCQPRHS